MYYTLPDQYADSVDLKGGLQNYKICTVKFSVVVVVISNTWFSSVQYSVLAKTPLPDINQLPGHSTGENEIDAFIDLQIGKFVLGQKCIWII